MTTAKTTFFALLLAVAGLPGSLRADVKLHTLFSPNAVLQRDKPLPVWGWAAAGEEVSVTLGRESAKAKAGDDGRWSVTLAPQPVSKTPLVLTVKGKNTVEVPNVLLGDVWLCSGQSNMTMGMGNYTKEAQMVADIAAADLPMVRQFGVEKVFATEPRTNVEGEWLVCGPRTAGRFSAVAFYFARRLHAETGVPIGILRSAAGGTVIECWLSQETYFNTPALDPIATKMRESLAAWETEKQAALKAGRSPDSPDFPQYPFGEKVRRPRAVTLHNGMIAPLIPCAVHGVVWYQGESNALDVKGAKFYVDEQRALIADWRRYFNDPSLPFLFVQLPNYRPLTGDPAASEPLAFMRESQRACLSIQHTGMPVTVDVGEAEDIHPRNKFDVGERLALWALAESYGKTDREWSGPLFRKAKVEGATIRVSFDHVGDGLMAGSKPARGPAVRDEGAKLHRFAIAGADRQWRWADAAIDGPDVVVSSPDVPHPVAVRYAFSANPQGCNLYNLAGLPASPFRSDDW